MQDNHHRVDIKGRKQKCIFFLGENYEGEDN